MAYNLANSLDSSRSVAGPAGLACWKLSSVAVNNPDPLESIRMRLPKAPSRTTAGVNPYFWHFMRITFPSLVDLRACMQHIPAREISPRILGPFRVDWCSTLMLRRFVALLESEERTRATS